jgi:hypothetical protein
MHTLTWKKGLFSSTYKLYDDDAQVGELSQSTFGSSSTGNLGSTQLTFKKKGFFSSETEITDVTSHEPVGRVKFNTWGSKADITINQKTYQWKYENFWNSKWSIAENGQSLITYQSSNTRGQIESSTDSDVLLLSGLFVHNRYLALMVVISVMTALILSGR